MVDIVVLLILQRVLSEITGNVVENDVFDYPHRLGDHIVPMVLVVLIIVLRYELSAAENTCPRMVGFVCQRRLYNLLQAKSSDPAEQYSCIPA